MEWLKSEANCARRLIPGCQGTNLGAVALRRPRVKSNQFESSLFSVDSGGWWTAKNGLGGVELARAGASWNRQTRRDSGVWSAEFDSRETMNAFGRGIIDLCCAVGWSRLGLPGCSRSIENWRGI